MSVSPLPVLHQQALAGFRTQVQALELQLQATQAAAQKLQSTASQPLQQALQDLVSLETAGLVPELANAWQSYLTESQKQLRLLATDLVFLQTARQPLTIQQRYRQSQERLTQLLVYTEALMGGNP